MSRMHPREPSRAWTMRARIAIVAAVATLELVACGGGGGSGGSSTEPPPPPPPSLTVAADAMTTVAGGSAIALHASTANATGEPTWALDGPGSLDATTGTDVHYVPPDAESFDAAATVAVTASVGSLKQTITLALDAARIPGHHWDVARASTPTWSDVAYANGLFVAVGDGGGLRTSADGATWAIHDTLPDDDWTSVAWSQAGWIALGQSGGIATSPDGITWTDQPALLLPDSGSPMRKIVAGAGLYLAYSDTRSYVSSDGKTWTAGDPGKESVAAGNGVFVAKDLAFQQLEHSVDGVQWQIGTTFASLDARLAFGNGTFVETDGFGASASADGVVWTSVADPPPQSDRSFLGFVQGRFYSIGSSVVTSADGLSWSTPVPMSLPVDGPMSGLAASADTFVGVVGSGYLLGGPDLSHLVRLTDFNPGDLTAVDFANGRFVAVSGRSNALTSPDGITWSAPAPLLGSSGDFFGAKALTHSADGTFVVVGYESRSTGADTAVGSAYAYSHDGSTWTVSGHADFLQLAIPRAVLNDGRTFVSVDSVGTFRSSPTGETWTVLGSLPHQGGDGPTGLAYGNGIYVTTGYGGFAARSTDAKTWTVAPAITDAGGAAADLFGVTFDGTRFVAVGAGGLVATSSDGATWTAVASATPNTLRAVRSLNGELLAVGDLGVAQTSVDGVHWTLRPGALATNLLAIAAGDAGFVAAGSNGSLQLSSH